MNGSIYLNFTEGTTELVFPCRCGKTHRGDYAVYDWAHHNCFHDAVLIPVTPELPDYFVCPDCGKHFYIEVRS